ncbi:MAG TPA: hypothetical protein VFW52_02055 [Candidatus Saccharimonadales bacterium]|nr:hypothetical protein [Candidatus Saccharimonadales bacterium]
MTERLDGNWEQLRRTGRFAVDIVTKTETNAWLENLGLPLIEDETNKAWADRTADERGVKNG